MAPLAALLAVALFLGVYQASSGGQAAANDGLPVENVRGKPIAPVVSVEVTSIGV